MNARTMLFNEWRKMLATVPEERKLAVFHEAAFSIGQHVGDELSKDEAVDELRDLALCHNFFGVGETEIEGIVGDELRRAEEALEDDADRERLYQKADEKAARGGNGHDAKEAEPRPLDCAPWWREPTAIPPRAFLYGKHFARKNIGASIGAGGRLKTSHGLFECVEMTVGRDLTTKADLPSGQLRAAFLSAEEDQDELDRRLAAICQHYGVTEIDLGGRLFVISVHDHPLRLATVVRGIPTLNAAALDRLADFIRRKHLDVWMLDPWVSFHSVNESANADMDLVLKEGLKRIAADTNSAGEIFHHPGKPKPGGLDTTVEDARGASAIIYAVRSARVFNFMTPDEAARLGISEGQRRHYVRVSNGKANMGPIGMASWLKIEIENLPNGDEVACSSRWIPPNPFDGVSSTDMATGAHLAATGAFRADSRSPNWFGYALADLLRIPISYGADNSPNDIARINTIIKTWIKNKVLKIEERDDDKRRPRKFIVPGTAAPHTKSKPDDPLFDDDELTLQ
jgi:hypothetical protein